MQLPKALLPSTEKEILEEIAEELDIPLKDVNKTFSIWLDYLEDINLHSDQCTVNFPNVGKMNINYVRLRHARNKKWAQMKKDRIAREITEENKLNFHKTIVPICVIYGTGRRNFRLGRSSFKHNYSFFTKEECIRRQNIIFFKEDRDFREKQELFEEYFKIPEQIRHENYKRPKDYKIEAQRQEQIKRCRMVRGKKIHMQHMSKKLKEQ